MDQILVTQKRPEYKRRVGTQGGLDRRCVFFCAELALLKLSALAMVLATTSSCATLGKQALRFQYVALLSQFPEDCQGEGPEPFEAVGRVAQPKTYALVLLAETTRALALPNNESKRRIRKAVQWLLDNADLDRDGVPGWGFPYAWDAFGDGTLTPAYTPYTIDTAFVLMGLLDALKVESLWTDTERVEILNVIKQVCVRWSEETWSDTGQGGYFWYSRSAFDAQFVTNVSAVFAAALCRAITEHGDVFKDFEYYLVQTRVNKALTEIVSRVTWRTNAPFWNYIPRPNSLDQDKPNDLLHHVYILWSAEIYRRSDRNAKLPWTVSQALISLSRFWREGKVYDFPQDVTYEGEQEAFKDRPASIRGLGMLLAFYSRYGGHQEARKTWDVINRDYGPLPSLRLRPDIRSAQPFYPRFYGHTLYGLALLAFTER